MNKFGNCPLCGKQVKPTNLRKIARQNQLYGFRMALDGIAATWGALIQNLRCDADLTDEQVQIYLGRFATPEQFIMVNGDIFVLPYL